MLWRVCLSLLNELAKTNRGADLPGVSDRPQWLIVGVARMGAATSGKYIDAPDIAYAHPGYPQLSGSSLIAIYSIVAFTVMTDLPEP
jgi:hypothetical protein